MSVVSFLNHRNAVALINKLNQIWKVVFVILLLEYFLRNLTSDAGIRAHMDIKRKSRTCYISWKFQCKEMNENGTQHGMPSMWPPHATPPNPVPYTSEEKYIRLRQRGQPGRVRFAKRIQKLLQCTISQTQAGAWCFVALHARRPSIVAPLLLYIGLYSETTF